MLFNIRASCENIFYLALADCDAWYDNPFWKAPASWLDSSHRLMTSVFHCFLHAEVLLNSITKCILCTPLYYIHVQFDIVQHLLSVLHLTRIAQPVASHCILGLSYCKHSCSVSPSFYASVLVVVVVVICLSALDTFLASLSPGHLSCCCFVLNIIYSLSLL